MSQLKNRSLRYAGVGVVFVLAISMFFVVSLDAEDGGRFRRGAHSSETKDAVHVAFEDNDYDAYVVAVTERNRQSMLTEEEFASHVTKIAKKQQIHDALVADDHETYLQLTDGSIHQLSEAAFRKKSKMFALKAEIKTALEDRNYDSFIEAKQSLRELLGDEYMGETEEVTEEQFNMLAGRAEKYGGEGFSEKKYQGCPYSKHEGSRRYHW